MNNQATKSIEEATDQSVQTRAKGTVLSGLGGIPGALQFLAGGNYRVSPWWSPKRDVDLSAFWKSSDHLSGALSQLITKVVTVPVRVLPRDNTLKAHQKQAEEFTIKFNEESEFGQGWMNAGSKWLEDYWSTDNGGFFEIIGDGKKDGPIKGPASGVAHLDSLMCQRTGDPDFPVLFTNPDGSRHKLYRTRVAFASDMPSARSKMFGVGYCAGGRCLNSAQNLVDMSIFYQEKLGSRPLRGILQGRGIKTDAILDALAISAETMDNRGFSIFSQLSILGDLAPEAFLELLDLISLPDGFDQETSTRLAMFVIALAFNVPIRWLWPASAAGATKADAMFQHVAGLGGGVAKALKTITFLLGGDPRSGKHLAGKFLPPHLKLVFDFQDDMQDKEQAGIAKTRADTRQVNLDTGVYDARTANEHALESGDLTQAQFDRQELEDGRLPGGEPTLALFHIAKEPFLSWLDLGVDNPLAVSANDAMEMLIEINMAAIRIQDVLANSSNAKMKQRAQQSLAALDSLKQMYAPLAQQQIQRDLFGGSFGKPSPTPEEETETTEKTETTETESSIESIPAGEKGFDFSVGAGEIIGGQLARTAQGEFINAEDMLAQIQAEMAARMGAGGDEGGGGNSAAGARAANRLAVGEAIGIDVDALALMKSGEATSEQESAMVKAGLASQNPDGSISMTTEGRGVLRAANSGDVDKAEQLKGKAAAPKKGPKGAAKKPKQSPEERRRERQQAQEAERTANRQAVAEGLEGRMDQADFDALAGFVKGNEPSPAETQRLARSGLVEIDSAGNPRMTTQGKRVMSAADKGDLRGAKDALSKASEKVDKTLARAQATRERATTGEEAIPKLMERATATNERLNKQADSSDATANSLDAEADAMQSMITNATTPEARANAVQNQNEFRAQARLARTEANEARKAAEQVIRDAETRAEEMQERIDKLNAQADQLENSVGGAGGSKGLVERLGDWWKRVVDGKAEVQGQPLPEADEIEVTEKEQDKAVAEWDGNKLLPAMAKGILEATVATDEEIAQAESELNETKS